MEKLKLSGQEVADKINELIEVEGESLYALALEDAHATENEEILNALGEWTVAEKVGGSGEGDSWHTVLHFTEHDVYIKIDGYYTSYDGVEPYGRVKAVNQVKKEVTVYE